MKELTKQLLMVMGVVGVMSPDNGYLSKRCRDCYYYSDTTVKMCDLEHEPTNPDIVACHMFEPKEE